MRPKPRTPSVFSYSSTPENFERSHLPAIERRVGLRDVAREREQQRHRVLGGGHDVRLGRVGDDDPALRGGLDVDVVDAHAGAPDHAQARRRARSARRSASSPSGSRCRRSRRCARRAARRSSRCRARRRSARAAARRPESPIFSLTSTRGRSPSAPARSPCRRCGAHRASLSTTQSMQAVSACTSAVSTAGNIADPQLVAPELAVGLDVDDAVRAQRRGDARRRRPPRRSRSCRRPASAWRGSATNGVAYGARARPSRTGARRTRACARRTSPGRRRRASSAIWSASRNSVATAGVL